MFQKHGDEPADAGAIGFVEAGEARTVEIEHAGHAAGNDKRQDELGTRGGVAGNVTGKSVDIGYDNRGARRR